MPWEHRSEPLAPSHVFAGRMLRQILVVAAIVGVALAMGTVGYLLVSKGTENLDLVDSFLEASMLLSGAGPLYTERTSSDSLKLFSSLYALFGTLIVVSSVGILASPIVHRVLHQLHLERGRRE
jgi:zinc transporter ZupT